MKTQQKTTEEDIQKWVMKFALEYCGDCWALCCNGQRFLIGWGSDEKQSSELFSELGIPVYRLEELDEASVKGWIKSDYFSGVVRTKSGEPLKKPAVVEHPNCDYINGKHTKWREGTAFALYVEKFCPAYDEEQNKCKVHDDSRRPTGCKQYPVVYSRENGIIKSQIKTSCPGMRRAEGIEDKFKEDFPDVELSY